MSSSTLREWSTLIGGSHGEITAYREVVSPYSGEPVARVGWAGSADALAAVDVAARSLEAPLSPAERQGILERASAAVADHTETLARIICAEGGKPIRSARQEVARAAKTLAISAAEAARLQGASVPIADSKLGVGPLAFTLRKPIGVVGAVTPFNFPLNLVAHKVGPALAAGCSIVLKPADKAPGAAFALADILSEAGLPDGWLNVLVGPPGEIVDVLIDDPRVRLLTFTGSASIGWAIAARAPAKRVALELGNATPAIVAADTDVGRAATSVAAGAFGVSGQACISVQRVYAHRDVYQRFTEQLVAQAASLVVGNPEDEETDVGPLITTESAERLLAVIDAARRAGATVRTGGRLRGQALEPTVITDVPHDADLARKEAFGPVVSVWPYDDLDDAIAKANGTEYGLQAGIFTNDLAAVMRASAALDFGSVVVNDNPSFRADEMPYGGTKNSGNTKEGPARAILEMTEECLVVLNA